MQALAASKIAFMIGSLRRYPAISPRIAIGCIFMILSLQYGGWVARIAEVQLALALNKTQLGFALFGMSIGAIAMTVLSGAMLSRISAGWATVISTLLYCVIMMMPAFAWNQFSLTLALVALGIGNGFMNVSMNAAAAVAEANYGIRVMPFAHAMYSTGLVLGALIAVMLTSLGISIEIHLILLAILSIIATILFLNPVLLALPHRRLSTRRVFTLPPRALIVLSAMSGCFILGEGAMADWSSVFLKSEMGVPSSVAGLGFAGFGAFMALGRFNSDRLRGWLGVRRLILAGAGVAVAGLLLVASASVLWVALVGFAFVGLGLSAIVPIIFAASASQEGVTAGVGIAAVSTTGQLTQLLGRPVIGALGDQYGLEAGLALISLALLLGAALAYRVKW